MRKPQRATHRATSASTLRSNALTAPIAELVLIRHGQSAGNVARDLAMASERLAIDLDGRDCDVPLSSLGESQAFALGRALRGERRPPDVLLASPFVRTQQTARFLLEGAGWDMPMAIDERLREKEFGILNLLTKWGVAQKYPDEIGARAKLGKFYYRPPGGESWVDVILRLRTLWESMRHDYAERRVVIVAHQVVVLCLRYIIEGMNEEQLLAVDRAGDVANCGLTRYSAHNGKLELVEYNSVAQLVGECTEVTAEPSITSPSYTASQAPSPRT